MRKTISMNHNGTTARTDRLLRGLRAIDVNQNSVLHARLQAGQGQAHSILHGMIRRRGLADCAPFNTLMHFPWWKEKS